MYAARLALIELQCVLERVVLRLLCIWAPSSFILSVRWLRANVLEAGRAGFESLATSVAPSAKLR